LADAPSLDLISANLAHALEPHDDFQLEPILDFGGSLTADFARTGSDFSELKFTATRVKIDQVSKLAGILFCSPDTDFGKREVLPHLDQFNERSEDFVEFYCAGFGTTQPAEATNEDRYLPVVAGQKWWYSTKAFNSLRKDLEGKTRWKYSGETDLILFTASRNASGYGYMSFSPSLVCNLEQMSKDGAFTSVRAFLEAIARLGEEYEGRDPVSLLSKKQEKRIGGNILKALVLSIFPKAVQEGYQKAEHLAFQDISK
jgi:hypothetical protein